jgi:5-methylthioadenosine/S-adenosylhomocysteine deaminase
MATLEGACSLGLDRDIGSLQPGKQGDIVVLDYMHPQPINAKQVESDLAFHTGRHQVKSVYVQGELVYDQGELIKIDATKKLKEIRAYYNNKASGISK